MQNQINDLNQHLYRFDPFLLDAAERLLMRDGKIVSLSPKVVETLLVLVENSGRILPKEELMQSLWPDSFVEESNLTQNISQIRRVLGEGDWIETVPKRGYRFAAPVQVEAANGHAVEPNNGAPMSAVVVKAAPVLPPLPVVFDAPLRQKTYLRWAAAAGVGLIVLSLGYFLLPHRAATQASTAFQQFQMAKLTTSGQVLRTAVSHDGKYVAYVEGTSDAQSLLIRQATVASQVTLWAAADTKFLGVTFSPDDTLVYYVAQPRGQATGALFQIPLLGGLPKKVLSGVDGPVALAPDGQAAAFVRHHPAQREDALVVANLENAAERKLLTRKRPEMISLHGPAWSPDGKLIACAAGDGLGGEAALQILAVNPADGAARPIGREAWSAVGQLAWLGDGSGLVMNAWRSSSAVYGDPLWLLTYPQGAARRLTHDLTNYDGVSLPSEAATLVSRQITRVSRLWLLPAQNVGLTDDRATQMQAGFGDNFSEQFGLDWTPDGRVVYASHASGNLDLWMSSVDGQPQQVTRDKHTDVLPVVSADGRYVVFVSDRSGARAIWRMEVDGNNPLQLTRGKGDTAPSLSPDGRWVVYSSWSNDHPTLWKVPMAGGAPIQLTDKTAVRPVVSPDGQWIACLLLDEKQFKLTLAVLPFTGGEPAVIETATLPEYSLVRWLPDSRALCYIVTQHGVSNLWSQPLDGSAASQLTHFTSDQIFRFAWSRDGKTLACERGLMVSDVVLFANDRRE
ncbi:MAG: PD40 domain-containing protein [Acidobacteria bacterium]|nr:PD40 domain-containing protein [Acidobacteriota bacterium]MBI3422534.1 PD40 domain-containing protein [Acidobacteriota bacterium]